LQNTEIRVPLVLAQLASVGAPVIETYPDQINTDGYSDDAPGAVELPRKLMAA